MDKYGWADGKPAGRGTRGGRCGPPARGPARSQRAGTTGGAAQAPGMCFSAATCSPGGVQDRRGLASFECSCCYPGNGPPGLQGLITFLKVFRSCEFWNDYINVALWGQGPAWVIPRFQSRASEKNPANKGENAACGLESLRGCRIVAAGWETSRHFSGSQIGTPGRAFAEWEPRTHSDIGECPWPCSGPPCPPNVSSLGHCGYVVGQESRRIVLVMN